MSNTTESYQMWSAVMHNLATAHAEARAKTFLTDLEAYTKLSPDNRHVVSPMGVLIAEMIALLSILRAQTNTYKEQALQLNNEEMVQLFAKAEQQTEIAASAIISIEIY